MPFEFYREATPRSSRWTKAHWSAEKLGSIWYGKKIADERIRVLNSGSIACTANLVLQDTIERIFIQEVYADIIRGIFLVRGENVLLLGEIVRLLPRRSSIRTRSLIFFQQDLDKDDYIPEPYRKVSPEEVHALTVKANNEQKQTDKVRAKKLQKLGFEVEHSGEILF